MFIRNNLSWINITLACDCLKLTRSSYYSWNSNAGKRANKIKRNQVLLDSIKAVHANSKKRYGSPKITKTLNKNNVKCSQKMVSKLMSKNDIRSIVNKKFKATTNSKHDLPVFDNILNRQFIVSRPNFAWVSDITYISTSEGWLYLATVIDLYSNQVIGHAMSDRMTKQLVINALEKALKLRNYPTGVIVHTDRGSQYASNAYKAVLNQHKLIGSMSRKGNCWDNAVAENFFGIIKKEYINLIKFDTRNQAKLGIFDYIEGWYNTQRIHSKLGYLTPLEFNDLYYKSAIEKIRKPDKNIKIEGKPVQL
jgi:transposase InsO family protein